MTTRTTVTVVTFRSPFTLPGWDESWPCGDYTVTTDQELLDTSFPAYRRASTMITLAGGAVTHYVEIDPLELAAAIEKDQATSELPRCICQTARVNEGRA